MLAFFLHPLSLLIFFTGTLIGSHWQIAPELHIQTPTNGSILQGTVLIQASLPSIQIRSYELAFSYLDDPSNTWFQLKNSEEILTNLLEYPWDTTSLADGDYNLRIRISLGNQEHYDAFAQNLHIRNYTPIEKELINPHPEITTPDLNTREMEPNLTQIPLASPTPYKINPAAITKSQLQSTFFKGGIFSILICLMIWLILRWREFLNR